MKEFKSNKTLLDRKKFVIWDKEKKDWLRGLSWKKALRIQEIFLSSRLIFEWRKNFFEDNPIRLKDILKKNI